MTLLSWSSADEGFTTRRWVSRIGTLRTRRMWRNELSIRNTKHVLAVIATVFAVLTVLIMEARAQAHPEAETELSTPLEPARSGVSGDVLLAELDAHNELRKSALRDYTAVRTYRLTDLKGKVHAEEVGRMEFRAPDQKTFVVMSESGSGIIRRKALNPLISSEIEAAAGKEHHDSSITVANYSLE